MERHPIPLFYDGQDPKGFDELARILEQRHAIVERADGQLDLLLEPSVQSVLEFLATYNKIGHANRRTIVCAYFNNYINIDSEIKNKVLAEVDRLNWGEVQQ